MPAYVVIEIDVKDAQRYEQYKALAPPSIAAHGGRYLVRGGKTRVLEGDWNPKRVVVLEFPSYDRAYEWWSSEQYASPKRMRQESASTNMILVEGL